MLSLKTVFNQCLTFKRFVIEEVVMTNQDKRPKIEVRLRPRKGRPVLCSECLAPAPVYDHLNERHFQYIPLYDFAVFLVYTMRRVKCPLHGVRVEAVEWADGKHTLSIPFMVFLANWGRRLSWKETAEVFRVSWEKVFRSVQYVVDWGKARRVLSGITAIGIDEKAFASGKGNYATLVWQLNSATPRLLAVEKDRTGKALKAALLELGDTVLRGLKVACTDMWKPFLNTLEKMVPQALNVLDRFHVVMNLNKAVDQVRAQEARELKRKGFSILARSKYCFLKRRENLTPRQKTRLKEILRHPLKTVRAWRLKEELNVFWEYKSPAWANWFLGKWLRKATRSKIVPIKRVAKTIRRHRELILNWFRIQKEFSNGITEGCNRKVDLAIRRAYGFRSFEVFKVAMFHNFGQLPEPCRPRALS